MRRGHRIVTAPHPRQGHSLAFTATTTAGLQWPIRCCRRGARQIQGTINGLGERCGNADLVTIVANLPDRLRAGQWIRSGVEALIPNA